MQLFVALMFAMLGSVLALTVRQQSSHLERLSAFGVDANTYGQSSYPTAANVCNCDGVDPAEGVCCAECVSGSECVWSNCQITCGPGETITVAPTPAPLTQANVCNCEGEDPAEGVCCAQCVSGSECVWGNCGITCVTASTPAPTPAPATTEADAEGGSGSAAKGDPHLMNMKGEAFDVMQTGNMMLVEIPRGSSPATLDLGLHADIERLGAVSCGPTFITSASITGRWIGVPLEIRSGHIAQEGRRPPTHTFAIRFDGKTWFSHAEMQRTTELSKDATLTARDRMFLFQVRGLDIAVSQPKRPRIFLDIQVKGLGNLKTEIGGLLGIDNHSSVEELPSGCEMSASSSSLAATKEDEALQWSARASS